MGPRPRALVGGQPAWAMSPAPLESRELPVDMSMSPPAPVPVTARYPIETKMTSQPNGQSGVSAKTQAAGSAHARTLVKLGRLERLFDDFQWPERRVFVEARKRAMERALEVLDGGDSGTDATRTALLVAAAELFGAMRVELAASPRDAARLAHQLQHVAGVSRIALAREVLRAPELLTVSPTVAVDVQLAMLAAFAQLRSASLWTVDDAEQVKCVRHVGAGGPTRAAKQLAQRLLAGESTEPSARGLLFGLSVGRWQQPLAALVGSATPSMRDGCHSFIAEAVPMLGAVLERDTLLAGNVASERALVESSERKLTRLGFDLHDGPIQEVAVLAEDLRLFGGQLEILLGEAGQHELVRGRMEDLDAQLLALEGHLRRLSSEVHAPVLLNRPFSRALRDVTQAFAARTNIEPRLTLDGEMRLISVSQQIALLNIVHEALTNVREHSDATAVEIVVSANANGVEAQVTDNGRGFDLEQTLIRAAHEGRLGMVAIHERVRLLGGRCRIDSRPGGPTVVSVALERWEPLVGEVQPSRVSA
jgi:signal transduction histidine kinase